ncbi:MAG: VacJ family lipoprotein [Pseudomonadales bacterium]
MIKTYSKCFLLAAFFSVMTGCAGAGSHDRDPLEPMNRAIYKFNDKADTYVMKPVAEGYRTVTPQPVRTGVRNFFNNLDDISSTVNYALQAKPLPSFYSFSRVILNSTAGVLGFFDLTGEQQRRFPGTDFGQTLARWGWKDSSYLVVPLFGPSTIRDGVGALADMAFRNGVIYDNPHDDRIFASAAVDAVSTRESLLGVEDTIQGAALDPYAYTRDGWLQMRAKVTGDAVGNVDPADENIDDLMQ